MKKWFVFPLVILAIAALLLVSGITIPLDFLDHRLESLAGHLLDRRVTIHGPVSLKTSLHPSLVLGRLTVSNPSEWTTGSDHLLSVEHAQAQISLVDLIRGDIRINNLEFSGVDLQLVTRSDHSTNYQFTGLTTKPDKQDEPSEHELTGLDRISLRDIQLSYLDELSGKQYQLVIDEAHGQGMPDKPLHLSLAGTLSGEIYELEISAGTLNDLLHGKESWQLTEGDLTLADISLDISGSYNRAGQHTAGHLALALNGHSLNGIGAIFDLTLPEIGDFSLETRIGLKPGMLQVSGIQLDALDSSLTGDLAFSFHGQRPTLTGALTIDKVDSQLFAALHGDETQKKDSVAPESKASQGLPWQALQYINSDLDLQVGRIYAGDLQIQNLKSILSLTDGDLLMSLSLAVMNIPLKGQIELISSESTPSIDFQLTSRGEALDQLLAALVKEQELQGILGAVSLKGSSSGKNLSELVQGMEVDLRLGESSLQGNSVMLLEVQSLSLQRRPGSPFTLSTMGELLGSPLKLDTRIGRDKNPQESETSLLHLQLLACDTRILLDSTQQQGQKEGADFHFLAEGEKLCGFLAPIEQFMGRSSDFSIKGNGSIESKGISLELEHIRMGDISLDARAELKADKEGKPQLVMAVHSEKIDMASLLHKGEAPKEMQSAEADEQVDLDEKIAWLGKLLTKEIFPDKQLLATDARLEVDLGQLDTGRGQIYNIKLSALVEDGKLLSSPFQAEVGGNRFVGSAAIETSETEPAVHLELAADDFKLSKLLKEFQIDQALDVTVGHVGLDLTFRGRNIQEMLHRSSYGVIVRDGRWAVNRESGIPLVISLKKADFAVQPGQPGTVSLAGTLNAQPLTAEIRGEGLFAQGTSKPLILDLQAMLADTELHINGQINRIQDGDNSMQLSTDLSGSSLGSLNELFGINLPPLGPYQIKGTLGVENQNSLTFHDMGVRVGDTALQGKLIAHGTREDGGKVWGFPITIRTELNAETIQLNDFQFAEWSPVSDDKSKSAASEEGNAEIQTDKLQDFFSVEIGEKLNGVFEVNVQEVLSGDDKLGSGHLKANLESGRYQLEKLQLDIPGGTVLIDGSLLPQPDGIEGKLNMEINHLDYGILARRTVPDSDLKGEINLSVALHSRAATPFQLKEHLNGQLRFAVVPEEFQAGIIDLWAVNIITAALPALMKGSSSEVNCLAGDFTLEDGIMRPEVFLLDTSNMRVQGKGEVDFKTNRIDFHMSPTPKAAHFFSMATPISVSGTIIEPKIGVSAAGVASTIFRQATSVVTVPFQWLFTDNLETDGSSACSAAMEWVQSGSE